MMVATTALVSCAMLVATGVVPKSDALVVGAGNARAEQIAKSSRSTKESMAVIEKAAKGIRNPAIKRAVLDILAKPAPTFLAAAWPGENGRDAARQALVEAELIDASVTTSQLFPPTATLSFEGAPGGIIAKHHGHPGGLAVHTAVNLQSGRALAAEYRARYGVKIDEDIVIASAILHDAMKAWTLQFDASGGLTEQPMVAGTSSHHPFIVAEVMHRNLPPDLVVAVASAHEPPSMDRGAKVAAFIRAGALLSKKDASGALGALFNARIEASINHLSDHDYVLADPAYASVDAALEAYGITDRWKKHALLAQMPGMTLYGALSTGGVEAMKKLLP